MKPKPRRSFWICRFSSGNYELGMARAPDEETWYEEYEYARIRRQFALSMARKPEPEIERRFRIGANAIPRLIWIEAVVRSQGHYSGRRKK